MKGYKYIPVLILKSTMFVPLLRNALIIKVPFEVDQSPPRYYVTLRRNGTLHVTFVGCHLLDMKMQSQCVRFPNECCGSIHPLLNESYLAGK